MSQIKHKGKYFILPESYARAKTRQVSESELWQCLKIRKLEIEAEVGQEVNWQTVIETLSDEN